MYCETPFNKQYNYVNIETNVFFVHIEIKLITRKCHK